MRRSRRWGWADTVNRRTAGESLWLLGGHDIGGFGWFVRVLHGAHDVEAVHQLDLFAMKLLTGRNLNLS
jgi:hypothetical protein